MFIPGYPFCESPHSIDRDRGIIIETQKEETDINMIADICYLLGYSSCACSRPSGSYFLPRSGCLASPSPSLEGFVPGRSGPTAGQTERQLVGPGAWHTSMARVPIRSSGTHKNVTGSIIPEGQVSRIVRDMRSG